MMKIIYLVKYKPESNIVKKKQIACFISTSDNV